MEVKTAALVALLIACVGAYPRFKPSTSKGYPFENKISHRMLLGFFWFVFVGFFCV